MVQKGEIIQRKNSNKRVEKTATAGDKKLEKVAVLMPHKTQQNFIVKYKTWILTLAALLGIQFMFGYFLGRNPADDIISPIIQQQQCSLHKDAKSAIKRAKSEECKRRLEEIACLNSDEKLYAPTLPKLCPVNIDEKVKGHDLGCFQVRYLYSRLIIGTPRKRVVSFSKEL